MRQYMVIGCLIVLISSVGVAACGTTREQPEEQDMPVLPRLEMPSEAIVLYEEVVVDDPDRTGNRRFMIRADGCFFSANNTQLLLDLNAPEQFRSDDPALFWNTPFGETPLRCLTDAQQQTLREAIRAADFPALNSYYQAEVRASTLIVKRWTVVQDDQQYTVAVEQHAEPPQLVTLFDTINDLLEAAPVEPTQ